MNKYWVMWFVSVVVSSLCVAAVMGVLDVEVVAPNWQSKILYGVVYSIFSGVIFYFLFCAYTGGNILK